MYNLSHELLPVLLKLCGVLWCPLNEWQWTCRTRAGLHGIMVWLHNVGQSLDWSSNQMCLCTAFDEELISQPLKKIMLDKYSYLYYELLLLPCYQLKPKLCLIKFFYSQTHSLSKYCILHLIVWLKSSVRVQNFRWRMTTVMNKYWSSNNNRMLSGYSQNISQKKTTNYYMFVWHLLNVDTACYEHSEM